MERERQTIDQGFNTLVLASLTAIIAYLLYRFLDATLKDLFYHSLTLISLLPSVGYLWKVIFPDLLLFSLSAAIVTSIVIVLSANRLTAGISANALRSMMLVFVLIPFWYQFCLNRQNILAIILIDLLKGLLLAAVLWLTYRLVHSSSRFGASKTLTIRPAWRKWVSRTAYALLFAPGLAMLVSYLLNRNVSISARAYGQLYTFLEAMPIVALALLFIEQYRLRIAVAISSITALFLTARFA